MNSSNWVTVKIGLEFTTRYDAGLGEYVLVVRSTSTPKCDEVVVTRPWLEEYTGQKIPAEKWNDAIRKITRADSNN